MGIYRVMVTGTNMFLENEGDKEKAGFVRNEYVWASSGARAIKKAERKIAKLILTKDAVTLIEGSPLSLEVDIVESGYSVWSLFAKEGFVFFFDP
jgi:hypothetical protein